jgi:hypothetical protein
VKILKANGHILDRLAERLLETETVEGTEFETIVASLNPIYPTEEPA